MQKSTIFHENPIDNWLEKIALFFFVGIIAFSIVWVSLNQNNYESFMLNCNQTLPGFECLQIWENEHGQ